MVCELYCGCVAVRGSRVHLCCSAGSEGQMDVGAGAGLEGTEDKLCSMSDDDDDTLPLLRLDD